MKFLATWIALAAMGAGCGGDPLPSAGPDGGAGAMGGSNATGGSNAMGGAGGSNAMGGAGGNNAMGGSNAAGGAGGTLPPGACNTFANVGTAVTATLAEAAAPLPPMTGGPIAEGTYVLTAKVVYPLGRSCKPLPATTETLTVVITPSSASAGTFQSAIRVMGSGQTLEQRNTISYTLSGALISGTITCPRPDRVDTVPYAATATELRLQGRGECGDGGSSIPMVQTLTKR
jgi:hypothetical protein